MWILYFYLNFTATCYQEFNWQLVNIGWNTGLAPKRRQAAIWSNDAYMPPWALTSNFHEELFKVTIYNLSYTVWIEPTADIWLSAGFMTHVVGFSCHGSLMYIQLPCNAHEVYTPNTWRSLVSFLFNTMFGEFIGKVLLKTFIYKNPCIKNMDKQMIVSLFAHITMSQQKWRMTTINSELILSTALRWRHNGRDSVSNHQPHECLPNRLFKRRSNKTSKLRVTGFCAGNSPGTDEFPAQMASYAENVSIWWRHHWNV